MFILGDNILQANLEDIVCRQQEDRADAALLVEAEARFSAAFPWCGSILTRSSIDRDKLTNLAGFVRDIKATSRREHGFFAAARHDLAVHAGEGVTGVR